MTTISHDDIDLWKCKIKILRLGDFDIGAQKWTSRLDNQAGKWLASIDVEGCRTANQFFSARSLLFNLVCRWGVIRQKQPPQHPKGLGLSVSIARTILLGVLLAVSWPL